MTGTTFKVEDRNVTSVTEAILVVILRVGEGMEGAKLGEGKGNKSAAHASRGK